MIYSNNTYDITNDISTYTRRDFSSVYDTSSAKWYDLDNGQYVEAATQQAAPTITKYYASKLFRNSNHYTKLIKNDAEVGLLDYMSENILMKGKVVNFEGLRITNDNSLYEYTLLFQPYCAGGTAPNLKYSLDNGKTWTTWDFSDTETVL